MPLFPPGVRRALRLPSSRERLARDLDDEVAFHLEQRIAELVGRGMREDEARAEALRLFGDPDDLREYCQSIEVPHMRRMRFHEWWEGWVQDLRFAMRQFARSPGFFAIAALTLALGIGATTSIFSVVRGVLLRPLPYADSERIVQVWQLNGSTRPTQFSDVNFQDVRERSRSFASLAQFQPTGAISVSGIAEPVRVRGAFVTREFFPILRIAPIRGRLFAPEEQRENGTPAVLISHGFWQRNFGGSDSALGSKLLFQGSSFTVVGIMPPTLDFPADVEMWLPRELRPKFPSRTAHNWQVLGRLADGVTVDQARREVSEIAKQMKRELGEETWMTDATLLTLQEQIVGRSRGTLMVLLAGSLLLLLIACANVVNLLIARMAGRQSEVALRVALGAGRGRLIQQCLAESLMLSLIAGALGVLLAAAGVKLLWALQPGTLPRIQGVRVDVQVLAFAIGICALAALVMGIVTAWRGTRGDVREALAQSQRTQGGSMSSERMRRGLVVAQVAMAVVLLVAAGLFGRSFMRLLAVDPGFRADQRIVVDVSTGDNGAELIQIYDALLERFRAIPGVRDAGGVNVMPLAPGGAGNGTFIVMSSLAEKLDMTDFQRLMRDPARTGNAEFRIASEGYFKTMGIPLLDGRAFESRDAADAPHVALISASLAKERWPDGSPLGKVIQFGNMDGDMTPLTVVGVVGDVREAGLAFEPQPTLYASYRQRPVSAGRFNFVLATAGDPTGTINSARQIVREVSPNIPPRIRTIETIVNGSVADRRFVLTLVGVFGIAALALAALGIYSVISYLVAQRSREIGIRVALGARSEDVVRMVLRQGILLGATGMVVGAAVAFGLTRLIEKMLYGVTATDPAAFGAVMLVLGLVAALASWVPARRAARVQAMEVLRSG
jgi:putative ABC transport system permease protein